MLQQILKDMYIEPELLEALNEDQKKTLFLKMRQEQVRRWMEREEKMELEEAHRPKAKAKSEGPTKSVSWLLGRDGDVQVLVIGEMEEFKSPKLICTGLGERQNTSSQLNTSRAQTSTLKSNLKNRATPDPPRSGRENYPPKTQAGIQLSLKENSEEVRTALHLQAPALLPESQEDSEPCHTTTVAPPSPPPAYRRHLRPVTVATAPSAPLSAALLKAFERSSTSSSSITSIGSSEGRSAISTSSSASGSVTITTTTSTSCSPLSNSSTTTTSSSGGSPLASSSRVSINGSPLASNSNSSSSGVSLTGGSGGVSLASTMSGSSRVGGGGLLVSSSSGGGPVAGPVGGPGFRGPPAQPPGTTSSRGKDFRVMAASKRIVSLDEANVSSASPVATSDVEVCVGRGRVAQLMKTFSVCGDSSSPSPSSTMSTPSSPAGRSSKPPIPSKPSHLRLQPSASLR